MPSLWEFFLDYFNWKRWLVLWPLFTVIAIGLGLWAESIIVSFLLGLVAGVASTLLSMK